MTTQNYLLGLRPPRVAMSLVLIAIAAHVFGSLALHPALPIAALAAGSAGFAIMIRGWWLFRTAGTAICPTQTATKLITHDVFAISRNPMYLGMILMLAAPALATGSVAFYVALAAFGLLMDRVFCPFEERKSQAEFGAGYLAYAKGVRRWL